VILTLSLAGCGGGTRTTSASTNSNASAPPSQPSSQSASTASAQAGGSSAIGVPSNLNARADGVSVAPNGEFSTAQSIQDLLDPVMQSQYVSAGDPNAQAFGTCSATSQYAYGCSVLVDPGNGDQPVNYQFTVRLNPSYAILNVTGAPSSGTNSDQASATCSLPGAAEGGIAMQFTAAGLDCSTASPTVRAALQDATTGPGSCLSSSAGCNINGFTCQTNSPPPPAPGNHVSCTAGDKTVTFALPG
jgi:hypothetical protein